MKKAPARGLSLWGELALLPAESRLRRHLQRKPSTALTLLTRPPLPSRERRKKGVRAGEGREKKEATDDRREEKKSSVREKEEKKSGGW